MLALVTRLGILVWSLALLGVTLWIAVRYVQNYVFVGETNDYVRSIASVIMRAHLEAEKPVRAEIENMQRLAQAKQEKQLLHMQEICKLDKEADAKVATSTA